MYFTQVFKYTGIEVYKVSSNKFCVFYFPKKVCLYVLATFFLIKLSKYLIVLSKNNNNQVFIN